MVNFAAPSAQDNPVRADDALPCPTSAAGDLLPSELRLMLACAQASPDSQMISAIRKCLLNGIDWTAFVGSALNHGLTGPVGRTLEKIGPEAVPQDILDAFRTHTERTRKQNAARFAELGRILDALAQEGIDAIPFKGPVIAMQAYGDIGLRPFRDLDFLIRDADLMPALSALDHLGYVRQRQRELTAAQLELIHRLQGQEVMSRQTAGSVIEPHTRLVSMKLGLDIDYAGLWERARPADFGDCTILTFSPEDTLITLAIHGGKELWWRINWACDVATFIAAHPDLDWTAVLERSRAQGCRRIVLLAVSLARIFFDASIPPSVVAAERSDRRLSRMLRRIVAAWRDGSSGPPSHKVISRDLFCLHDRATARAKYVLRTLFLPGPHHVGWLPLPRSLQFAYVPLKLVHDLVMLPAYNLYQSVRGNERNFRTG
jgi:hypothetical protein